MTEPIDRPPTFELHADYPRTLTAEPSAGTWKSPLRVIVADDHPLYRQGIVRALEAAGEIVVAEAEDGRSALELISTHQPDVALVDVSMPGLDGIDVVEHLAAHGPDVPVVLLSAFSDEPLVRSGLLAGAAAYVTKAADRDDILAAVTDAARLENAPRVLARARRGGGGDP
jgi:two-component system nitrate/nitrite response regulator NarL